MPRPYHSGAPSDHFDGMRFFNPDHPSTDKSLHDLLRWRRQERVRGAWPAVPPLPVAQDVPPAAIAGGIRVSMVGHATVLIQFKGLNILTDPVWSQRASPLPLLGPRRFTPPGIAFDALPPIHAVLISHNHYDHLDLPTLKRLWRAHRPRVIAPLGNDAVIRRKVPQIPVETGDWGARFALSDEVCAVIHPANHWSARTLRDRRLALWGGFVLETGEGPVYFVGDTGYGSGEVFRAVRRAFGPPCLAIIPIGAYEPRWFMAPQHVDPREAVRILEDTGAAQALGIHFGTFRLTDEAQDAPLHALRAALDAAGLPHARFRPLSPGEVWQAPPR
ncbi:MBL fold metallo-hydrolase [Xanthobacter sp. AM11]|uniref:MBL fold metallo-hydrolase n=1 Tax=Xanthobacter sp. AM11 TaxID=3380643 RepID=UPI0039BFCD7F